MKISATTINFASNPIMEDVSNLTAFDADVFFKSCRDNIAFAYAAEGIFPAVAQFLYWNAIRTAKRMKRYPVRFFWENRDNMLESDTYVESQIHRALGSVVARSCYMNKQVRASCGKSFLKAFYKKDAEKNRFIVDENVTRLALEIAAAYEDRLGKSVMETRFAVY